jgi:hypothetical protein
MGFIEQRVRETIIGWDNMPKPTRPNSTKRSNEALLLVGEPAKSSNDLRMLAREEGLTDGNLRMCLQRHWPPRCLKD